MSYRGRKKIEYELLLDVDWLYARTNTTLNTAFHHRLNFPQKKDCHPSFALCNTLVISWKQNLQFHVQSFTLLMGVLKLLKQSFSSQRNLLSTRDKMLFYFGTNKTCNGINFKTTNDKFIEQIFQWILMIHFFPISLLPKLYLFVKQHFFSMGYFLNGNFITLLHLSSIQATRYKTVLSVYIRWSV